MNYSREVELGSAHCSSMETGREWIVAEHEEVCEAVIMMKSVICVEVLAN